MIKPILLIELPEGTDQETFIKANENIQNASARDDYHIIIMTGKSEYPRVEIITASDVSIHKP